MSAGPTAVLLRHLPDHRHHPAELTIFTARSGHGRPPSYWCPATRRKGGGCSEPRSICPGACSRAVICREGAPRDRWRCSRVHSIGGTPALVSRAMGGCPHQKPGFFRAAPPTKGDAHPPAHPQGMLASNSEVQTAIPSSTTKQKALANLPLPLPRSWRPCPRQSRMGTGA